MEDYDTYIECDNYEDCDEFVSDSRENLCEKCKEKAAQNSERIET